MARTPLSSPPQIAFSLTQTFIHLLFKSTVPPLRRRNLIHIVVLVLFKSAAGRNRFFEGLAHLKCNLIIIIDF